MRARSSSGLIGGVLCFAVAMGGESRPLEAATVAQSGPADLLLQVAEEYRQAGQLDDAIHGLRKALLIAPHHQGARRLLTELEATRRTPTVDARLKESPPTARESAIEEALRHAARGPQPTAQAAPVQTPPPAPQLTPTPAAPSPTRPVGTSEGLVDRINDSIAPLAISGESQAAMGMTRDDFIVQEANGDLNERNFRIFSGPFRYNTFDPRIFSRFRLNVETTEEFGWQFHSNTTVDPWSVVGTTERVTVVGATPTDSVDVQLKWWSNTNTAINETFLTAKNGDSIATPEIETSEGRTIQTPVTSAFGNTFTIPSLEIDYSFQPIRWLWTGYKSPRLDWRIFPLALEDQAITSDDPLGLSNHHIYWEPSPWLDEWVDGRLNVGATPTDFTRGRWSDDLSFFTRDSDLTRLTALRGTTLRWQAADHVRLDAAVASPKGLWQEYDSLNSVLGMTRLKGEFLDGTLSLGGLYTTRWGFREHKRDATNHVSGVDASVTPMQGLTLKSQVATSTSIQDRTNTVKHDFRGWVYHGEAIFSWWGERLTSRLFYTHMDTGFEPGLANFQETRDDQFWGRHLALKRRLRLLDATWGAYPSAPVEEFEAFRIGDGVDIGRDAWGMRLSGSWWEDRVKPLVDVRNVHTTDGKYLETVVRQETSIQPLPWFTAKTLVIYHDLPKTVAGIDPFIVDADTRRRVLNAAIVDGRDPSLQTYSLGGELFSAEDIQVWAAWERTNDTTIATGDFPRGLLNSSSFATATEEGSVIRSVSPFLFGQGFFPQPPYPFFDIYRAGVYASPSVTSEFAIDWTRNEFEHAGQIDDNLNHIGFTAAWSPIKGATLIGRYVASWAIDVARENAGEGAKFTSHHNFYGGMVWRVSEDARLHLEYGVSALAIPRGRLTYDPNGDFYPTLDTEHLLRIYYTNRF